jgi:hypothetical protein
MKLVSWDVGIYNLSYCILEKNEEGNIQILDWDIVNLVDNEEMKKDVNLLFENIPRKLQEKPQLLGVDYVVIENQPSLKNPKMKSIQMILYSYFLILGKIVGTENPGASFIQNIDFCSASNKLKIYDGPEIILEEKKKRGKKNVEEQSDDTVIIVDADEHTEKPKSKKGSAVKYADKKRLAIEQARYYVETKFPAYKEFFASHKKKDDLSDSLLQGLYYLKKK